MALDKYQKLDRVAYLHMFGGFLAGVVGYIFTVGIVSFSNEVLGIIISFIVLYLLQRFSVNRYSHDVVTTSAWISNGVVYFYFIWMVTWIILLNYG